MLNQSIWNKFIIISSEQQHCNHLSLVSYYILDVSQSQKSFSLFLNVIQLSINVSILKLQGEGKWDLEKYRFGAVSWCRFITEIAEVDNAYNAMLTVNLPSYPNILQWFNLLSIWSEIWQPADEDKCLTFDRYKELVVEFFVSEDANTPARHIFGPLELCNFERTLTASSKQ